MAKTDGRIRASSAMAGSSFAKVYHVGGNSVSPTPPYPSITLGTNLSGKPCMDGVNPILPPETSWRTIP